MHNNAVQVFGNKEFGNVRVMEEDGKFLFCGSDVARALGYVNINDALRRHCKGVVKRDTLTNGGMQSLSYLPEGDVYRLITHSKIPSAEKFEAWVFEDVLPSIRKTGGYGNALTQEQSLALAIVNADTIEARAVALSEYRIAITAPLKAAIEEQKPKVTYCDMVLSSDSLTPITVIAKDYGMSAQAMNKKLAELGIQYKKGTSWHLYQKYADCGYVASKTYTRGDMVFTNTEWTQEGRMFLYQTLKASGILPTLERECA